MTAIAVSISSLKKWDAILSRSKYILAITALTGSWLTQSFENSWLVFSLLCLVSAWAVLCHMAEGFSRRYIINVSLVGPIYLVAALFSPARVALLAGAAFGVALYMLFLSNLAFDPKVKLISGDRFYRFRYPLDRIIPLAYLACEPLLPFFKPIMVLHWTLGMFNLPIWRVSLFDPLSLYRHIGNRAVKINLFTGGWTESLFAYRHAMGLLNLLDSLRKFEENDLDGAALAASARLALRSLPCETKEILSDVARTLNPMKYHQILSAFDLAY
jgi:hypothetical protein